MQLVEQHIRKFDQYLFDLCFQSKNLYNSCLYIARQHFFNTKEYVGFKTLYNLITKEPVWNECGLPKKVCNQIVKQVDSEYKSFFKAIKSYTKNPAKFNGRPKIPHYKDTTTGQNVVIYEKGSLGKRIFKKTGKIQLSQTNIIINTQIRDWDSLKMVRIVSNGNHFCLEVIYQIDDIPNKVSGGVASCDLGLSNLATVTFSNGVNPLIYNGRPLKSINQFYNKTLAKLQNNLELKNKKKTSKRKNKLTHKRNNKVKDYLHKISTKLVNHLESNDISTLVIGKNDGWKKEINIGKRNNQNFVQIPFYQFIQMLKYKCEMIGISIILREESYTSKCSFLDMEPIKKHDRYKGKRVYTDLV